jgi:hypothetical protein
LAGTDNWIDSRTRVIEFVENSLQLHQLALMYATALLVPSAANSHYCDFRTLFWTHSLQEKVHIPNAIKCHLSGMLSGDAERRSLNRDSVVSDGNCAALLLVAVFGPGLQTRADEQPNEVKQPPFVYAVENTVASFPALVLRSLADLPIVTPLTDPFMWSDGSGRVSGFDEWSRRR